MADREEVNLIDLDYFDINNLEIHHIPAGLSSHLSATYFNTTKELFGKDLARDKFTRPSYTPDCKSMPIIEGAYCELRQHYRLQSFPSLEEVSRAKALLIEIVKEEIL